MLQSRVGLQKGFIDFVVGPFVAGLGRLLPGLWPLLGLLAANRASWDDNSDDVELLATVDVLRAARAAATELAATERATAMAAAAAAAAAFALEAGEEGGNGGGRRRSSASDSASGDDSCGQGGASGIPWVCI
jgi:hypothetical protein